MSAHGTQMGRLPARKRTMGQKQILRESAATWIEFR